MKKLLGAVTLLSLISTTASANIVTLSVNGSSSPTCEIDVANTISFVQTSGTSIPSGTSIDITADMDAGVDTGFEIEVPATCNAPFFDGSMTSINGAITLNNVPVSALPASIASVAFVPYQVDMSVSGIPLASVAADGLSGDNVVDSFGPAPGGPNQATVKFVWDIESSKPVVAGLYGDTLIVEVFPAP